MRKLIDIPSIIIAVFLAWPAHAELRTLPGSTTQIAVERIECFITIDGKELMNGTCHYRLTVSSRLAVYMTLPESATQIAVNVGRVGRGRFGQVRLWAQTPDGKQHREFLGDLLPVEKCKRTNEYVFMCGPCFSNERVLLCSWRGETPPALPRTSGEAYSFPPPQSLAPPPQSEQQVIESTEKLNRMLEKHTKQPPVR